MSVTYMSYDVRMNHYWIQVLWKLVEVWYTPFQCKWFWQPSTFTISPVSETMTFLCLHECKPWESTQTWMKENIYAILTIPEKLSASSKAWPEIEFSTPCGDFLKVPLSNQESDILFLSKNLGETNTLPYPLNANYNCWRQCEVGLRCLYSNWPPVYTNIPPKDVALKPTDDSDVPRQPIVNTILWSSCLHQTICKTQNN